MDYCCEASCPEHAVEESRQKNRPVSEHCKNGEAQRDAGGIQQFLSAERHGGRVWVFA